MKTCYTVACLLSLAFSGVIHAQNRLPIGIMDLEAGVGLDQSQVNGLSDMLTPALQNTGFFRIIERKQVNQIIREQGFQNSNLSSAQMKRIGGILGVEALLIGKVNFQVRDRNRFGEYNVDIRLVSVKNGEVLSAAGNKHGGKCRNTGQRLNTSRELMECVARDLAQNSPPAQQARAKRAEQAEAERVRQTQSEAEVQRPYVEKPVYDFGKVGMLDGSVSMSFTVQNPTKEAITITEVKPNGGNLQLDWPREPIPPQGAGQIKVKLLTNRLHGEVTRDIIARLSTGNRLTMQIKAIIE